MASFTMNWAPPAVQAFAKKAKEFLIANGPSHVQALEKEFQELFAGTDVLTTLSNSYLQRVLSGAANNGEPVVGADVLVMSYSSTMALRLIKDRTDVSFFGAKPTNDNLTNYPANTLILVVSDEPIEVKWYCLEEGADFDRFDSSLKIRYESTETYANGSVIYVDARNRFPVLPARPQDTFVVLSGAVVNCQIATFEANTLKPLGASMSAEDSSVLCVMLELLDPRQPAYPLKAVQRLISHPDHYVRWAATTALGKYSRDAALEAVQELAAHDPHKFIRDAAQRTLRQSEVAA